MPNDPTGGSDGPVDDASDERADTFGVAIHVTQTDLQFLVRVPSDIDSGWTDPEAFQRLVEEAVWDVLDKQQVLRDLAVSANNDTTVPLGTVSLRPDGTVVDHTLRPPDGL